MSTRDDNKPSSNQQRRLVDATGRYQTYVDGKGKVWLEPDQYVVSFHDRFRSYTKGVVDGKHVVVLNRGDRVVSWDTAFTSCGPKGKRVDGKHCLILKPGQRVVCTADGFRSCKPMRKVDGVNCVVLEEDEKVVSWEDGFRSCRPGSRIDGRNCVVVRARGLSSLPAPQPESKDAIMEGTHLGGPPMVSERPLSTAPRPPGGPVERKVAPLESARGVSGARKGVLGGDELGKFAQLARTHMPRLIFHEKERYFPISIEAFMKRCMLVDDNGKVLETELSYDSPLDRASKTSRLRLKQIDPHDIDNDFFRGDPIRSGKCTSEMYCSVYQDAEAGFTNLEYHFFYSYNGPQIVNFSGLVTVPTMATHVGDFETFIVRMDVKGERVLALGFVSHGDMTWISPKAFRYDGTRRLDMYVALHSHATYPFAKDHILFTHGPVDFVDSARCRENPRARVVWEPSSLRIVDPKTDRWAWFPGRFGNQQTNRVDSGKVRGVYGPCRAAKIVVKTISGFLSSKSGDGPYSPFCNKPSLAKFRNPSIGLAVDADGGYKTYVSGRGVVKLLPGDRVVSFHDGYRTYTKGLVDGKHVLVLPCGARVVSWQDGFKSYTKGIVDNVNVLVLRENQRVMSRRDGRVYPCVRGDRVDGKNCFVQDV